MIEPRYQSERVTLYCADCKIVMAQLESESIDLVVTSPPYGELRDYNGYVFEFENIAGELWRLIKPGGVVVWIVGDQTVDGSETGTPFVQALYFKGIGFHTRSSRTGQSGISMQPQLGPGLSLRLSQPCYTSH